MEASEPDVAKVTRILTRYSGSASLDAYRTADYGRDIRDGTLIRHHDNDHHDEDEQNDSDEHKRIKGLCLCGMKGVGITSDELVVCWAAALLPAPFEPLWDVETGAVASGEIVSGMERKVRSFYYIWARSRRLPGSHQMASQCCARSNDRSP